MRARLNLRNDNADLARLAEFASEFALRHKLADEDSARLQIILDELFTNVVKYGYESAAGALGCAIGTVRSRIFRAREELFIDRPVLLISGCQFVSAAQIGVSPRLLNWSWPLGEGGLEAREGIGCLNRADFANGVKSGLDGCLVIPLQQRRYCHQ
jgi:hypothetical protein